MPGPNEILQQTGPNTEPVITQPVGEAGIAPINEAQSLSDVHAQLADLQVQSVSGPHTLPTTNHEATTATVTPITMPAAEEPVDKTATPWWKNMLRTRRSEQQGEKEELPDAA